MSKKCFTCGAELADEAFVCSNCGAIQIESDLAEAPVSKAEPAVPAPEPAPAATTARVLLPKLWMRIVAVLAIVAVVGALAWKPLAMLIAPKLVLVSALSNTGEALADRGEGGPVDLFTGKLNDKKPISTEFEYTYTGPYTNDVQMDLVIVSDGPGKQWSVNGSVAAGNILFSDAHDISIYGNRKFLAFSSDLMQQDAYYGIAYDDFRQQLENSIFAETEDPDPTTVSQVEAALQLLQLLTDTNSEDFDKLMEPYQELVKDFILDMDCETGKESITLGSKDYSCRTVTLKLSEKDISKLLEQFAGLLSDDEDVFQWFSLVYIAGGGQASDAEVIWQETVADIREAAAEILEEPFALDLKFCIYRSKVIYLDALLTPEKTQDLKALRLQIELGANPKKDDLRIYFETENQAGDRSYAEFRSEIRTSDDVYQHQLSAVLSEGGDREEGAFTVIWNKDDGVMNLAFYDTVRPLNDFTASTPLVPLAQLDVNLQETKNSFILSYTYENEFEQILFPGVSAVFAEKHKVSMTCTNAGKLTKPEYIPLSQWDDDLSAALQFLETLSQYQD